MWGKSSNTRAAQEKLRGRQRFSLSPLDRLIIAYNMPQKGGSTK